MSLHPVRIVIAIALSVAALGGTVWAGAKPRINTSRELASAAAVIVRAAARVSTSLAFRTPPEPASY